MDFYLVNGTHFANPAQPRRLFAHPLRAAEAAMDLVNCLRADIDPVALPPATGAWFEALAEAQRHRLASQGIPADAIAEYDLPDLADFDVWIETYAVDIDTGRQITTQTTFDDTERDAMLAALRLLQSCGCPDELLDIATNGERHAILSPDAIDALCERLNMADRRLLPRIAVAIEGGLVSGIVADQPVTVLTIDYDVEGADEDSITEIPQDNGCTASAVVGYWSGSAIDQDPAWIGAAIAAINDVEA